MTEEQTAIKTPEKQAETAKPVAKPSVQKQTARKFYKYPFSETLEKWRHQSLDFIKSLKKLKDILRTNFELGRKHYNNKNFADAVMRFKFVVWLEPKHTAGWYWLGMSNVALGNKKDAIKALKEALKLNPEFKEARDALTVASGNG